MRIEAVAQEQSGQRLKRLLGVFVCLCFALQPLCFPLHLALVDHTPDPSHEVVKGSAGHSHPNSLHHHHHVLYSGGNRSEGQHPTHPVEDHAKFLPALVASPGPVALVALGLLPASLNIIEPVIFSRAVAPHDAPPPRPLPKLVSSPRAPPVVA